MYVDFVPAGTCTLGARARVARAVARGSAGAARARATAAASRRATRAPDGTEARTTHALHTQRTYDLPTNQQSTVANRMPATCNVM